MRWRVLGGFLLVLVTGWLLAGIAAATFARTDSRTYPAGFAGASWIQAPDGAAHAFFRLPLNLAATPDLATLWIEANQQYWVYVNGEYVGGNQPPARSGQPAFVDPVDLSWRLRQGSNGIGVEVANGDGHPAAFRARLTLTNGGRQVSDVTSPATWLATGNVQQVYFTGSGTNDAGFSSDVFDASGWPHAARAGAEGLLARSLMPQQAVAGTLTGQPIAAGTGSGASTDIRASTVVRAPPGAAGGWLRVIAADAYTISLDGHAVASQPTAYFPAGAGTQRRPQAAVQVYDIGPYLHAGRNLLMVHVHGGWPAVIYLDGVADGAAGAVRFATGPQWQVSTPSLSAAGAAGQAAGRPAVALGPVSRVWPDGVRRYGVVPSPTLPAGAASAAQQEQGTQTEPFPVIPSAVSLPYSVAGIALLLGLWVGFAAAGARPARIPFGRALLADAAGHLPALVAAGALTVLARLPNWVPPWPYIPAVFWLLVALLAAGKLLATTVLCRTGPGNRGMHTQAPRRRLLWPANRVHAPRSASSAAPAVRGSAGRLAAWAVTTARLPFPATLAMAEAGVPAGTVTFRPGAGQARQRADGRRPGAAPPDGPRRPLTRLVSGRLTWPTAGVVAIALAGIGLLCYQAGYEPYSGDETASLLTAQSIRAHLLPRFPSGLLYLKGELYHYPLAVFTAIVGTNPVALRLVTVLTYGLTVLAFGLLLLPIVLRGHRIAQVALTLLFATAPLELGQADLVRMYQQEQLFAVLFAAFFLLALRAGRVATGLEQEPAAPGGRLWALATRWSIPLSAVTLIGMYFSHEESFILLPAVPVALVAGLRLRWLRDRRWLAWGLPALALIAAQYALTLIAKMPVLGFDKSNEPYVHYDPTQVYYYLAHYLLAIPAGSGGVAAGSGSGTLYLLTSLAVVAGVAGAVRRDFGRLFLCTFFWLPVLVLSILFSAQAERYIVILLPMLIVLAGLGALDILGWVRTLLTATRSEARERRLIAGLTLAATIPGFVWLAGSMPARIQDYGLAISRLAGSPYAQQQADYGTVAVYLRAHERPGDLFITLAPSTVAAYYAGRAPDMVIQPHLNRFIYLTEKNGVVVEDYFGRPVILTASDLEQVIAAHRRIWLMTDQGPYFDSAPDDMTALIRAQFAEVAEGTQTALYFRGGLCVPRGG